MPLFGLIGTIVGLIGMFDSLSADVTVEFVSPQLALALKTTLYGAIFSSIYKIIASRGSSSASKPSTMTSRLSAGLSRC